MKKEGRPPATARRTSKDGSALGGIALIAGLALVGAGVGWLVLHGVHLQDPPRNIPPVTSGALEDEGPPPVIDPACTTNGCLRSVGAPKAYTKDDLAHANDPQKIKIETGYTVFAIEYFTSGTTAHASVAIPLDFVAPPEGYHIVSIAHATFGLHEPCEGPDGSAVLAGSFGAHNLIGVAPGEAGGATDIHPYLVLDVEGHAVLDALRAARNVARLQKAHLSGRFAMTGSSQGGHATLAAAMLHKSYAPDLDIRAFAVAGPVTAWEEHFRSALWADHPPVALEAMVFYGWMAHYHYDGPTIWSEKTGKIVDAAMKRDCIFDSFNSLENDIGQSASDTFSSGFLDAYRSGQWGAYSAFGDYFKKNRIAPYTQSAPLKIYQGDADDEVSKAWTDEMVRALRAGGVSVDYETVPGGRRGDVAFGPLSSVQRRSAQSLAWIRNQLNDTAQ